MRGLKLQLFSNLKHLSKSHLLQMRGLKPAPLFITLTYNPVASFTDAWIETALSELVDAKSASHLLQMRGLKHLCLDREHHRHKVASFTDAWIET